MKITPEINFNEVSAKNSIPEGKRSGPSFETVLNRETAALNKAASGTKPASAMNRTADILLIPPIDEQETVARLEKFLDTLEEYSNRLDNPYYTPRDLSGLITEIESGADTLERISGTLAEDSTLKPLINDVLVRSTAEVIKFNRGDYI